MDNSKKVALYCRVAYADQFTMDLQHHQLQCYAESKGLMPCVAYLDNGFSGISDDRPAFKRMNEAIAGGEIGTVIIADVSRLWRQFEKAYAWHAFADRHGVTVLYANDPSAENALLTYKQMVEVYGAMMRKKEGA